MGSRANECREASDFATSTYLASHRGPMAYGQYLHNTRKQSKCLGDMRFPASPWMLLQASGRRSGRRAALGFRANECREASDSATSTYLAFASGLVAHGKHVQNTGNHAKR